jgi:hypothetical protein
MIRQDNRPDVDSLLSLLMFVGVIALSAALWLVVVVAAVRGINAIA